MKDLKKNLKFILKYAYKDRIKIILLSFLLIFNIIFSIVTPIMSAKIVVALTSDNYMQIIILGLIIFLIGGCSSLFEIVFRNGMIKVEKNILSLLEVDIGRNILKLENSCLDEKGSGLFIHRISNDTYRISSVFRSLIENISYIFEYIGILVAIFTVNKLVFLYVIFMITVLWMIEKARNKRLNEDDKKSRSSNERVSGFVSELVRGARDIKMLNSEDDFLKELSFRIEDANKNEMKMRCTNWKFKLAGWEFSKFFNFMLIVLLALMMKYKFIVATTALVLYNYANRIDGVVWFMGYFLEYIKDFNLSCERVSDICDDKKFRKEKFGKKHLGKLNGDFEFKNVSFSYNDKLVLNDLSFKINANETVAFVGRSGAGKTTIFNLLCKMYDVQSGIISMDGEDINNLDKDTIRGNITIISQSPYIFNMSIKDNLKLVKSDLTDEEMINACHIACLDDFINELPNGYDTVIGEGGVNLSGGQKQRLAIARALIQKTEIILFDEATSALDNETQNKIQQAIDNMKNEYTILIIAHRLSTIINCDRILYLDNGKIIASGTHNELLKNCREYKKLYESEISKND